MQFDSLPLDTIRLGSFHLLAIVHTLRLKVFQLSQTLRSDDWETQFSALRLRSDPLSSLRIIAVLCSAMQCNTIAHTPRLRVFQLS